jgi:DNA-binding MarR family transcriptional regulator
VDDPEKSTAARIATTPLAYEIEFLMVRVFVAGTRLVNRRLQQLGLSARSYAALAIACSGVPVRQRDLADLLELDPSQIVALVDELEKVGLVRREPDPGDRRIKAIMPTEQGLRMFAVARDLTGVAERESLAELDAAERDTLRRLLRKVVFPGSQ